MSNRILKESIKRSEQIDALTWFEEVVFYRLIVTADDYGCLDARPVVLRCDLFPTKESLGKAALLRALRRLEEVGLVRSYQVEGRPYLFLPGWERCQRVRNKLRKFPPPPEDVSPPVDGQLTAACPSESESESVSESVSESRARRFTPPTVSEVREYCESRGSDVDPERFVDFYTAKGWKIGAQSMKDWKAALRTWERHHDKRGNAQNDRADAPAGAGDSGKRDWGLVYDG